MYAALDDIRKMYNSVWLEERKMHLYRFLWRDNQDEEMGLYAFTRVNIGDWPAVCIAQWAMWETERLQMFAHLKEECRILEEDSYVDDILSSQNDLKRLDEYTKQSGEILKAIGLFLKPWLKMGKDRVFILQNQIRG